MRPRYRADGTFKIVQFTDLHLEPNSLPETVRVMEAVLDTEKPDFVAYTGDICDSKTMSCQDEAMQAANFRAAFRPSEERKIPWALTFGNWDRAPDVANWTGQEGTEFIRRHFRYSFN